jgi:Domain of unknown function (DUF5076)
MFKWRKLSKGIDELSPPPEVYGDHTAHEVLRCWITENGQLLVSFRSAVEPENWGMLFADVSRHVGSALESEGRGKQKEVRTKIFEALENYWSDDMDDQSIETNLARKN